MESGDVATAAPLRRVILVVYYHCDEDMRWLDKFAIDVELKMLHCVFILVKVNCSNAGNSPDTFASQSDVVRHSTIMVINLPNVGGSSSHGYAYWMSHHLSLLENSDDDASAVVSFVKGDGKNKIIELSLSNPRFRSLNKILRIASIEDFGCLLESWGYLTRGGKKSAKLAFGNKYTHVSY